MTASTTLRDVIGLDGALPRLADATLIMIDFQNTYRSGVMALDGAEQALAAGARLLAAARAAGAPVVHVVNDGGEGTPYDIRAEIGALGPEVAPAAGEPVVVKQAPNAFHGTELEKTLRELGAGTDLVLAGFMTHMCVAFTAEGAYYRGYRPTVVAEATATRSLTAPDGTVLPAAALQTAALTTVGDLFGLVARSVEDVTGEWRG
ncbi:isochorismatase family protein [Streptomyces sp. WAC06614]|uniref:isochorismatase family protein n=1 Tax=Streptomyces sp. WAC06614 TaxID=2487416 RepID=UPI000F770BDE|nr:isochorismatase family protein [Streptomyces sp. WAC06614]RSS52927.1 isochorismatase family protein [Streptomyces sp. WAC06614]